MVLACLIKNLRAVSYQVYKPGAPHSTQAFLTKIVGILA